MKKITLLAAVFAAFAMNAQEVVWEDSFETYEDFKIESIGDWTQHDNDGLASYGSADYDFVNEQYIGTAIIFNPSLATPDPSGSQTENADQNPNWVAKTGDKGLFFFASTNLTNNDYFISPQINLGGATGSSLSFWAKSITDAFGLEKFKVLVSTTGTDQADFSDLGGEVFEAPIGDYIEYNFDLSAYDGEQIYLAINYVAEDSFILLMDDFKVEAVTLSIADASFNDFNYYVNNSQLNLTASTALENVKLFNLLGQEVVSQKLSNSNETVNIASLDTGIYVAKVSIDGSTKSFKIIKK